MDQPSLARRLPWGVVLTTVLLVVVVLVTYKRDLQNPAADWLVLASATLAGVAAFVIGRRLLGSLWGLVLALTLVLHPLYTRPGLPVPALGAEALKLMTLAGVMTACRYTFSSRPRPVKLMGVGLFLALIGGLAWLTAPVLTGSRAGLVTALVDFAGLALACLLAWRKRGLPGPDQPTAINVALAGLLAVLVPAAGFVLAWPLSTGLAWLQEQDVAVELSHLFPAQLADSSALMTLLRNTLQPHWQQSLLLCFTETQPGRDAWGWPYFWVVLALMVFGLARTVWRGRAQWSHRQAPYAWLLTLFALAVMASYVLDPFYMKNDQLFLPLATLAILLSVFAVGDWIFGVGEKIRLTPPGEEPSSAVGE
jgi:hypothetical protein